MRSASECCRGGRHPTWFPVGMRYGPLTICRKGRILPILPAALKYPVTPVGPERSRDCRVNKPEVRPERLRSREGFAGRPTVFATTYSCARWASRIDRMMASHRNGLYKPESRAKEAATGVTGGFSVVGSLSGSQLSAGAPESLRRVHRGTEDIRGVVQRLPKLLSSQRCAHRGPSPYPDLRYT
jgi:hypothetical protein